MDDKCDICGWTLAEAPARRNGWQVCRDCVKELAYHYGLVASGDLRVTGRHPKPEAAKR